MKRYLDFQREAWADRTASHMRAARRNACVQGIGGTPPCAGVIDTLPMDDLGALIAEGWVEVPHAPSDLLLRRSARRAMLSTLADDLDCLSMQEHTLVERMLIGDGQVVLDSVPELEAAYTLRMRLWCDLGHCGPDAVRPPGCGADAAPSRPADAPGACAAAQPRLCL